MIAKMLKGSFFLFLNNIVMRGTIFFMNILCIRLLSQDNYGRFSLVRSTAIFIEGLISGAIDPISIKSIAEKSTSPPIRQIITINIILLLVALFITSFFTRWLSEKMKFEGVDYVLFSYITILVISAKLFSLCNSFCIGLEKYKEMFYCALASILITSPIAILLTYKLSFLGAILGISLVFTLDAVVKFVYLSKLIDFKAKSTLKVKSFFLDSGYLFASVLMSSSVFWISRLLLSDEVGGLSEVAKFEVVFQFLTIIMIVTGATTSTLLPLLSKGVGSQGKKIFINMIINIILVLSISFFFIYFYEFIFAFLGKEYVDVEMLAILKKILLVALFFTISSILNKVIISFNKSVFILFTTFISSIIFLLNIYFSSSLTAMVLADSYLLFYFSLFFIYLICYLVIKHGN